MTTPTNPIPDGEATAPGKLTDEQLQAVRAIVARGGYVGRDGTASLLAHVDAVTAERDANEAELVRACERIDYLKTFEPMMLPTQSPRELACAVPAGFFSALVDNFDRMNGDANYTTTEVTCRNRKYEVQVRRANKPTPHELRKEAVAERDAALNTIATLQAQHDADLVRIAELEAENAMLKPFYEAIRSRHNGYNFEPENNPAEFEVPESPVAALNELLEESEALGLGEAIELRKAIVELESAAHQLAVDNARLNKIVDALPVTADGVRVTPTDGPVYASDGTECWVVWTVDSGTWAAPIDEPHERIHVSACYSTPEAAAAARNEGEK